MGGAYAEGPPTVKPPDLAAQAREARAEVETALDQAGWPWSARLSRWLDALVVIEEGEPSEDREA
jgi:hypothetical protein